MKKEKRYGSILSLGTLQFNGNFLHYFIKNSDKFVVFYLLPRNGEIKNFVELYVRGKLIEKKNLYSPKNIFLSYLIFYFQYLQIIFKYFEKKEKIYFFNTIPVFFFFNSIIKLFRNLDIVYWVQDYWPTGGISIKIFRKLMHYYHDRARYTIYLTDRLNRKMNKRVVRGEFKKTVMWGTKSMKIKKRLIGKSINVCFIGVLVERQNIDFLIDVISKNRDFKLKLIGSGSKALVDKLKKIIKEKKVQDRVYFPNRFFYGKDLYNQVKDCHIGVALYEENKRSVTYFADPSKIKQYAEFDLPIVMTDSAEITKYIKEFSAGVVVEKNIDSVKKAILEIKNNYSKFKKGLEKFNKYFYYEAYYKNSFKFLEKRDGIIASNAL